MPAVSLAEWQRYLSARPNAHFLQTGEWGELKSAFGWEPVRLVANGIGAQVLFRKLPLGLTIGYVPKLGLEADSQSLMQELVEELDRLCGARHAIACKIEPDAWESAGKEPAAATALQGAAEIRQVSSTRSIQPRRTLVVDLRRTEEQILGGMKPKCRYNVRLAGKKGVSVEPWADLGGFHRMLQATGKRDAFAVHSEEYYTRAFEMFHPTGLCELFVARLEELPLASLMVFAHGRRAWYVYGGSTEIERERMPNYLLQWEAMRWAKRQGCEEYDLWGVPDEDESTLEAQFEHRHHGLWGVYRFKRGFGGELRRAVKAVDRVYQTWLYPLYLRGVGARDSA